jgi:hypothetical protein
MHTNIDTAMEAAAVKDFITYNQDYLPTDFPTNFFLHELQLIMDNNIFSFGDSYWLQLFGTAMGTPQLLQGPYIIKI